MTTATIAPRIGICVLPEYSWPEAKVIWQRVEELGAAHGWTYDHLSWAGLPDSPWHSTFPFLTAAAMVTERLPLGTFVASPNFRHPALFAKDAVTLDDISGGRFLLGLGAGGDVDSRILGGQHTRGERTRRFAEFVRLLDQLLTQERTTYAGEFYSVNDYLGLPRSVQNPRVPFLIAANGPRGIKLAAQLGEGWVTTGPAPRSATDPGAGASQAIEEWWQGVAERSQLVSAAEVQHRPAGAEPLRRYLSLDSGGIPALSSLTFAREQIARAGELGFTDVIIHWPRPNPPYEAEVATLEGLLH